jgi:hypothetical protein
MPLMFLKCRLGDVGRVHPDLVVARMKASLEKNRAPCNSSSSSSTTGMGNLSLEVTALRAR